MTQIAPWGAWLLVLAASCGDNDAEADAGSDGGGQDGQAFILPRETADEAALSRLARWADLPVLGAGRYQQQSSYDRETGVPQPVSMLENGNKDLNNFVCAGPEAAGSDPWIVPLHLDLESCPEDYVRGLVLSRFEGSGRLARLWMTALSVRGELPDREVLRIYVDDRETPFVQVPLAEVFDGTAGEIFAPPFGAGETSWLAWYYPVVFSSKLIVALDGVECLDSYYHQTDVVLDDPARARQAAPTRLPLRDDAIALLERGPVPTGDASDVTVILNPGEPVTVLDRAGPATLEQVTLRASVAALPTDSATAFAHLAPVRLTVAWDGATESAMDLPLPDLFAATLAVPENTGGPLAVTADASEVAVTLRLPMPFAERAEWRLTNQGAAQVEVRITFVVADAVPDGPFGNFHAQHHETLGPTALPTHPLLDAEGPGRLVGTCLLMEGHVVEDLGIFSSPLNFLEGDEWGRIDGEWALRGTGTEDYLNGAFYFEDGPAATPFAGWWGIVTDETMTPRRGQVSACRWHVLGDAIDFQSEMLLELEIGPGYPESLERYRSVAYYYR